jgi:hypothetical protein
LLYRRYLPEEVRTVGDIVLQPRYSTREIPGRCIKCLAEQEYGNCLRELLTGRDESKELEERYEALVSFLTSPELQRLRDESEKYLAEGKDVKVVLHLGEEPPRYEIKLGQAT